MDISDIRKELGLENIDFEDISKIKYQLQTLNDTIQGGLRSANIKEYRNTYVINAQDSLDDTYPMYVHFNIIPEMVKIVSIQLSFWFENFRAYSTAASSGGAVTSASGGGETPTTSSGGASTPTSSSGGASTPTTSAFANLTYIECGPIDQIIRTNGTGYALLNYNSAGLIHQHAHTVTIANHAHTVTIANHAHTVTIASHTHTGGAHTHGITYGIFEDSTSPTVIPSISRDNGLTYGLPLGSYTADQENLDITRFIDTVGSKMIKFTSNARTRLSVQITVKLDIKAR